MTAQQRLVVETNDIAGVEFECPRCAGRLFIPLDNFDGIPDRCPNCREVWFSQLGGADHVLFHDVIRGIREITRIVPKPKFRLRFEIAEKEPA